jgi:hypothetical protein
VLYKIIKVLIQNITHFFLITDRVRLLSRVFIMKGFLVVSLKVPWKEKGHPKDAL